MSTGPAGGKGAPRRGIARGKDGRDPELDNRLYETRADSGTCEGESGDGVHDARAPPRRRVDARGVPPHAEGRGGRRMMRSKSCRARRCGWRAARSWRSTSRSSSNRRSVVLVIAAAALLGSCGGPSQPAAPQPATVAWDSMNPAQKLAYMKTTVLPRMKALFMEYDPHRYPKMDCVPCHSADRARGWKMPNPDLTLDPLCSSQRYFRDHLWLGGSRRDREDERVHARARAARDGGADRPSQSRLGLAEGLRLPWVPRSRAAAEVGGAIVGMAATPTAVRPRTAPVVAPTLRRLSRRASVSRLEIGRIRRRSWPALDATSWRARR